MSRDTIRLPHDAYRLLQTLRAAGLSAYVVGGCVRDSLLGRLPGDWDICTSARPDEMKALFCSQRLILTGEKHGTVAVILHGKPYEMTTYRLDGSYRAHRHPDNVQFVDDLAADLARRDFTINAMAYAPGEGVIDLYGGRSDLAARVVRCVGTPADRFAEDALRILRALRFSAKLGFALDPATAAAALTARDTLHTVSAERLYTVAVQKYHYNNLKPFLDITLEEVEKNGKIRVLSTSARDVVEEYLTVNQHLSREVEGRLVVEA